jgi:hypothetical protein
VGRQLDLKLRAVEEHSAKGSVYVMSRPL